MKCWVLHVVATLLIVAYGVTLTRSDDMSLNVTSMRRTRIRPTYRQPSDRDHIIIATFVCDKPEGNLAMLFKVLLYSIVYHKSISTKVTLMVVFDGALTPQPDVLLCDDANNKFKSYLSTFNVVVEFYPTVANEFLDKFGRCASSKLWIHDILPSVELAIVLDVDTLFLENPIHLWELFFNSTTFNTTIIYGAASEGNQPPYGMYFENVGDLWGELGDMKAGPYGVNSGVLLVNLTLARHVNMSSKWLQIYNHVPSYSTYKFFDQDLLNIFLHQNPEHYYPLPCKWNQRADFNNLGNNCPDLSLPLKRGLIHGNNKMFVIRSFHHFRARMQHTTQYHRSAFFFYLSSIKNHPLWCMKNSTFSHDDVKIEIGSYGRPPDTWIQELGFWFWWKGGWHYYATFGVLCIGGVFFWFKSRAPSAVCVHSIPSP